MNLKNYISECAVSSAQDCKTSRLLIRRIKPEHLVSEHDSFLEIEIVDGRGDGIEFYVKIHFLSSTLNFIQERSEWHDSAWCSGWEIVRNLSEE